MAGQYALCKVKLDKMKFNWTVYILRMVLERGNVRIKSSIRLIDPSNVLRTLLCLYLSAVIGCACVCFLFLLMIGSAVTLQ